MLHKQRTIFAVNLHFHWLKPQEMGLQDFFSETPSSAEFLQSRINGLLIIALLSENFVKHYQNALHVKLSMLFGTGQSGVHAVGLACLLIAPMTTLLMRAISAGCSRARWATGQTLMYDAGVSRCLVVTFSGAVHANSGDFIVLVLSMFGTDVLSVIRT